MLDGDLLEESINSLLNPPWISLVALASKGKDILGRIILKPPLESQKPLSFSQFPSS